MASTDHPSVLPHIPRGRKERATTTSATSEATADPHPRHADTTHEDLWTPEQVADYLGISVENLYWRRSQRSAPPAYKVGRNLRFFPSDVRAWVLAHPA